MCKKVYGEGHPSRQVGHMHEGHVAKHNPVGCNMTTSTAWCRNARDAIAGLLGSTIISSEHRVTSMPHYAYVTSAYDFHQKCINAHLLYIIRGSIISSVKFFFYKGPRFLLLEQPQIQRQRLSHPSGPLRMIPLLVIRIRMHQCRQRSSVDHQPRDKGTELFC